MTSTVFEYVYNKIVVNLVFFFVLFLLYNKFSNLYISVYFYWNPPNLKKQFDSKNNYFFKKHNFTSRLKILQQIKTQII